jgi:hypothetical protein
MGGQQRQGKAQMQDICICKVLYADCEFEAWEASSCKVRHRCGIRLVRYVCADGDCRRREQLHIFRKCEELHLSIP